MPNLKPFRDPAGKSHELSAGSETKLLKAPMAKAQNLKHQKLPKLYVYITDFKSHSAQLRRSLSPALNSTGLTTWAVNLPKRNPGQIALNTVQGLKQGHILVVAFCQQLSHLTQSMAMGFLLLWLDQHTMLMEAFKDAHMKAPPRVDNIILVELAIALSTGFSESSLVDADTSQSLSACNIHKHWPTLWEIWDWRLHEWRCAAIIAIWQQVQERKHKECANHWRWHGITCIQTHHCAQNVKIQAGNFGWPWTPYCYFKLWNVTRTDGLLSGSAPCMWGPCRPAAVLQCQSLGDKVGPGDKGTHTLCQMFSEQSRDWTSKNWW